MTMTTTQTTTTRRSHLTRRGIAALTLAASLGGVGVGFGLGHQAAATTAPKIERTMHAEAGYVCWSERNPQMPDGIERLCGNANGYQVAWDRGVLLNQDGTVAHLNELTGQIR